MLAMYLLRLYKKEALHETLGRIVKMHETIGTPGLFIFG